MVCVYCIKVVIWNNEVVVSLIIHKFHHYVFFVFCLFVGKAKTPSFYYSIFWINSITVAMKNTTQMMYHGYLLSVTQEQKSCVKVTLACNIFGQEIIREMISWKTLILSASLKCSQTMCLYFWLYSDMAAHCYGQETILMVSNSNPFHLEKVSFKANDSNFPSLWLKCFCRLKLSIDGNIY